MRRLLIVIMALGPLFNAIANQTATEVSNTSEASATNVMEKLVASPWGLRLDTESFSQRDDGTKEVDYVRSNLYPTLSYSITANDVLYAYPQLIMTKSQEPGDSNYEVLDDYLAFRYDKMKLLSEESHGVDFSFSSRYYTLLSDEARKRNETYGMINQRLYFTKKFGDQLTIQSENRFYFYQTNSTYGKPNSKNYKHILYLTPVYQLSNSLSSYVELRQTTEHGRRVYSNDELRVKPGIDYKVSDNLTLGMAFMNFPIEGKHYKSSVLENELSAVYSFNQNAQAYLFLTSQVVDTENSSRNYRDTFDKSFKVELDLMLKAF